MWPVFSIGWDPFWLQKIIHLFIFIIPKKCSVMYKTIFCYVLRIPPAFFVIDRIIIFLQLKFRNRKCIFIEISRPFHEWLRITGDRKDLFFKDKRNKEGFFVYNDSPTSTISFDNRKG